MRATLSLESLGFNRAVLSAPPTLSAIASDHDLRCRLNDIQQLCAGVDLSPQSSHAAMTFLARLPEQRRRVETQLKLWEIRERDNLALAPYYEEVLKIHHELRVCILCVCVCRPYIILLL